MSTKRNSAHRKSAKKQTGPPHRKSARKSAKKRPKTQVPISTPHRPKISRASQSQSLIDLQLMARSAGIPYGGLRKEDLIAQLNKYHH